MEPRILVLDGNQRASLAAVRSLGSKGLWVTAAETTTTSLAGQSRFAKESVVYPDPCSSPRLFFETILNVIQDLGITFLLPITETTTYIILQYRNELPDQVTLPFPAIDSIEQLANKNRLFEIASAHRVPIPETVFCQNANEGLASLSGIKTYPIVLKPFKSKVLLGDAVLSTRVLIAYSPTEARELLQAHSFFNYPFTIQSFVKGTGQGVFALFKHGSPVCYFSHRRLREKPPTGGVSVLSESAPLNQQLKESAERLLLSAKWHGVAMVEFRVAEDGTGYLMEVNPRFWGSLQLAIDSGVDFPWWLFLVCTDQPLPELEWKYARVRWILGDLDRLFIILKSPSSVYSVSAKLREILRFCLPGLRTRHEVNRWGDLGPFWFELKQYLHALRS